MTTISNDIKDFINYCKYERNLSSKTIKAYRIDLKQLDNFFISNNLPRLSSHVTKKELKNYLITISKLKPKSIKRKIATIKSMFNYLEFEDKIEINPFRKMRIKIKENNTLPKLMDINEIEKILSCVYSEIKSKGKVRQYAYFESLRNALVIELLFATGGRVSEIANLRKSNINLVTGLILITGKGNKERITQICNQQTMNIMREYVKNCNEQFPSKNIFLLINRFGKRLSEQSIRFLVKKLAKKAGINRNITPHVFRHTFATLLLEKDVDIKYIQVFLGHSSILTTQIYTHVNRKKQKQILQNKHPRKDLVISHPTI